MFLTRKHCSEQTSHNVYTTDHQPDDMWPGFFNFSPYTSKGTVNTFVRLGKVSFKHGDPPSSSFSGTPTRCDYDRRECRIGAKSTVVWHDESIRLVDECPWVEIGQYEMLISSTGGAKPVLGALVSEKNMQFTFDPYHVVKVLFML